MITQLSWPTLRSGIRRCVPFLHKSCAYTESASKSSRYCYTVWLRHLITAHANGMKPKWNSVAELGPGGSIGVGLAALLSGASRYYGLDIVPHVDTESNLRVFDELADLFLQRAALPGDDEFPQCGPRLPSYEFPRSILTESILDASLQPERLERIRQSIVGSHGPGNDVSITYVAPWTHESVAEWGSVDFVLSQAVLEHVDDVEDTYNSLYRWLSPDGVMSHVIDFKCHGTTRDWNGHWTVSDAMWRFVRANRSYLINRLPHSAHIAAITKAKFRVLVDKRVERDSNVTRRCLATRFRSMPDEDVVTSGALVQAQKSDVGA